MPNRVKSRYRSRVDVEFVIPCKNEARVLEKNIDKLLKYLDKKANYSYRLVIASNGSSDATARIANEIAQKSPNLVRTIASHTSGRGRTLKRVWLNSNARVVAYMDADLATSLSSLPRLIDPLLKDQADLVIGNRNHPSSQTRRAPLRQIIGRAYARLARLFLGLKVSDFQCGFKAIRQSVATKIIPSVKDNNWFFDTELIDAVIREKYRLVEVPVKWHESSDTSVRYITTIFSMLAGLNRLSRTKKRIITPERIFLAGLLALAAVLYLTGLQSRGWANPYYTMATQSAASSWKAFFFGSLDKIGFVSIDKLPMIVWPSAISVRLFGMSDLAVLWPYVAAGVLSVYVTYRLIRYDFGAVSGLVAGLVFLLIPVGALIFRFNNPDAYLVLALLLAAFFFRRTLARPNWSNYLLFGLSMGLAFQAKTLQALIILPIFLLIYATARYTKFCRVDIGKLFIAMAIFVLFALWWPVAISLIPAQNRPYIGSTSNNNVWQLINGYNGLNRLSGRDVNPRLSKTISSFGGQSAPLRLLQPAFGVNIGILLPFSLVIIALAIWRYKVFRSFNGRTLQLILWSAWLLAYALVFSFMRGAIHPYYVVILISPVAALFGISVHMLRFGRTKSDIHLMRLFLGCSAVASGLFITPYVLSKYPIWQKDTFTWLPSLLLICASVMIAYFIIVKWIPVWPVALIYLLVLCVPILSTIETARSRYIGYMPTASPAPADISKIPSFSQPSQQLIDYLTENAKKQRWLAATLNSIDAASIQLMSDRPVMALGGFAGKDNILSPEDLERMVDRGELRYFVASSTYLGGQCRDEPMSGLFPLGKSSKLRPGGDPPDQAAIGHSCVLRLNVDVATAKRLGPWLSEHGTKCLNAAGWVVFDLSIRRCQGS